MLVTNFWIIALGLLDRTVEVFLLCFVQVTQDNPFKALLGNESLSCSELGQALTNQYPSSDPTSPTSSCLAVTDPIQTKTTPVPCKADDQVRTFSVFKSNLKRNYPGFPCGYATF